LMINIIIFLFKNPLILTYTKIQKYNIKITEQKKSFVVESQPLECRTRKQRPGLGYNHGLWI
ncbi:hypothetical protein, partial [Acinetobacter oleivorans]|uniref:hypothetical protein n=1 Tax=Acinetobacter oleivorans TaxID=1148157 RepID=UPI001C09B5B7